MFHGKQELGEVHQLTFAVKEDGPLTLMLGGRSWRTKYIDWSRKKAYVEPTDLRGRSQWLSTGQPMHFEMCQAIAAVLSSEKKYEGLSSRAVEFLAEQRDEFSWLEAGKTTLVIDADGDAVWWTFAGKLFNAAIADRLACESDKVATDNLGISFSGVIDSESLVSKVRSVLTGNSKELVVPLEEDFIGELKFSECLSQQNIDKELIVRPLL